MFQVQYFFHKLLKSLLFQDQQSVTMAKTIAHFSLELKKI